jgi:hypothetical protein
MAHEDNVHTFQFTIEGVELSDEDEARMLQAAQEAALAALGDIDRVGDAEALGIERARIGGGLAGRALMDQPK